MEKLNIQKKTILIIGGTGVLSSAVVKEALARGMEVTMINRGNNSIPNGVRLIQSDKDNVNYIERALNNRNYDAVIDFLCYNEKETERSISFYSQYTRQYFYISSCAVYDTNALNGKMGDEESPKGLDIWDYSTSKWESEKKAIELAQKHNINYTIIRPSVTYGDTRIPYGIYPPYGYHGTFIARILNGKPIIRWNQGINRCNMMRVEDFAVGVVGLIGNPQAYNEAFNVCGDEAPSFNEVLHALSEVLGKEVLTVDVTSEFYANEIPHRKGELLGGRSIDSINSNAKIKNIVPEFKQNIGLKQGIEKTVTAYLENNYQKGIDWQFDAESDRIIRKWCKLNKISYNQYNLGFIDYLGNANYSDRNLFDLVYHKDDSCYLLKHWIWEMKSRIKSKFSKVLGRM